MSYKANKIGGKKYKRGKKNTNDDSDISKPLIVAKENQIYAIVKSRLGGNRINVDCSDGIQRSAIIPGKFYKRVWFNIGDVLLCDFDIINKESDCIIVHKYSPEHVSELKLMKINVNFIKKDDNDTALRDGDDPLIDDDNDIFL
jgi:translation initiation factor 1A